MLFFFVMCYNPQERKSESAGQTSKIIGIEQENPDCCISPAKVLVIQIIIQLSWPVISCVPVIQVHVFISFYYPVSYWNMPAFAEKRRKAEVSLKDSDHMVPIHSECTLPTP
ncbi:hypothetical protein ILYODFUR_006530 [Ilyodon furcidens]|uniref:Uncharacterized protein n=1 Tax=Ilyodon furcidens TaxID=33524 RepID=A0ABV0VEG8_9TELE